MKILDEDDFEILRTLDCLDEHLFVNYNDFTQDEFPYFYGYSLCTVKWEKPYKETDSFLKKCFLSFYPDKKIKVPTNYMFFVRAPNHYYWVSANDPFAYNQYPYIFEEVFENVSEELKEKLIYHLDIFAIK